MAEVVEPDARRELRPLDCGAQVLAEHRADDHRLRVVDDVRVRVPPRPEQRVGIA